MFFFLFCFISRWKPGPGRSDGSAAVTRRPARCRRSTRVVRPLVRRGRRTAVDDVGLYQQLVVSVASHRPHHLVRFDVWRKNGRLDVQRRRRTQISVQDVPTGRRQPLLNSFDSFIYFFFQFGQPPISQLTRGSLFLFSSSFIYL